EVVMDARCLLVGLALIVSLAPPAGAVPAPAQQGGELPAGLTLAKGDRLLFHGTRPGVAGLGYSSEGKMLATGGGDRVIRLWDRATGKQVRQLDGHQQFI